MDETPMLRLRLQLEMLEHNWTKTKQTMLIHGKRGGIYEPTVRWALWNGGVYIVLGALWLIPRSPLCGGSLTVFPGLIALFGGLYIVIRRLSDAKQYAAACERFAADRQQLLDQIARCADQCR